MRAMENGRTEPGVASLFLEQLEQWKALGKALAPLSGLIDTAALRLIECLEADGKILTCGNGGSACEAMHLAEELLGRYRGDRPSLAAICLAADPTYLTCAANDFGFDAVFERAVRGLGRAGDVLVGLSTSGASANVVRAFTAAKDLGITTIGLLGADGGEAQALCDLAVVVPERRHTPRIQEAHMLIVHTWCEAIERRFGGRSGKEA